MKIDRKHFTDIARLNEEMSVAYLKAGDIYMSGICRQMAYEARAILAAHPRA